jgi:hypothetical protein
MDRPSAKANRRSALIALTALLTVVVGAHKSNFWACVDLADCMGFPELTYNRKNPI